MDSQSGSPIEGYPAAGHRRTSTQRTSGRDGLPVHNSLSQHTAAPHSVSSVHPYTPHSLNQFSHYASFSSTGPHSRAFPPQQTASQTGYMNEHVLHSSFPSASAAAQRVSANSAYGSAERFGGSLGFQTPNRAAPQQQLSPPTPFQSQLPRLSPTHVPSRVGLRAPAPGHVDAERSDGARSLRGRSVRGNSVRGMGVSDDSEDWESYSSV
ncbi:hypothetical protein V8E36_009591, partial [Tilletia maclaganii]